ncbi:MAG: hypothetical protein D6681_18445 [Calditrichaeota bacterium]|nr:MAG: hypothetical protein D6681_18445 [Calditrichota bacterium]
MKRLNGARLFVVITLGLLEVFYLAACSEKQPMSPQEPGAVMSDGPVSFARGSGSGGTTTPPYLESDLLLVRRREENENGVSTAVIGPAGGVLVHADHRLIIPPGALNDTIEFTFSMPLSDTLMFELGPDGTQFNLPVHLELNYDHAYTNGLDDTTFFAVVWNPTTTTWDSVASSVNTELNFVDGTTTHLSRYAISKRSRSRRNTND